MGLPHRLDSYHVKFPSTGLQDSTIVAFKTDEELKMALGRKYPIKSELGLGECVIVKEDEGETQKEFADGDIIFVKQGMDFMPLVNEFEKYNTEQHQGTLQKVLDRSKLTQR